MLAAAAAHAAVSYAGTHHTGALDWGDVAAVVAELVGFEVDWSDN